MEVMGMTFKNIQADILVGIYIVGGAGAGLTAAVSIDESGVQKILMIKKGRSWKVVSGRWRESSRWRARCRNDWGLNTA